jgi:hypothetical protein
MYSGSRVKNNSDQTTQFWSNNSILIKQLNSDQTTNPTRLYFIKVIVNSEID